jgi:hypothetical protein
VKNIVVSIGGTGTQVAAALVRLLALGFPVMLGQRGVMTSASDEELEIWRVDTDQSSGAGDLLKTCLEEYRLLQDSLERGWGMKVKPNVIHLNPLALPRQSEGDNSTPTLEGILNSGLPGRSKQKTQAVLDLFYTTEEQKEDISRGFYQKPFVGAPIMSIFASSLEQGAATDADNQAHNVAAQQVNFLQLQNQSVRFFLCGSLHGGTGASGIAVFGQFLRRLKEARQSNWQIAACLLAPFCLPPQPFKVPRDGTTWENERIKAWFADNRPPAAEKFNDDEKVRAFRQIARGFYADLENLNNRALHNLSYYETVLTSTFDQLYLVGKPGNMDQLPPEMWSNGGSNQRNPLNSAEVVAAIAALRYFSGNNQTTGAGPYIVASATESANGPSINLYDLPRYEVEGKLVDPEKVFLATALARHLIRYEIKWDKDASTWDKDLALGKVYSGEPGRKQSDAENFERAAQKLREFMQAVLDAAPSREMKAIGWNQGEVWDRLDRYLPTDAPTADALTRTLVGEKGYKIPLTGTRVMGKKAVPAQVGHSMYQVNLDAFRKWFLPEDAAFNRGAYFRQVWWEIYQGIREPPPAAVR